jgi:Tfp pilus assembly protein PilP
MKKFIHVLSTFTLLSIACQAAMADELKQQMQALESAKETIVAREAQLKESEATLKSQSDTLRCLSQLLEAYNACETEHTLRSEAHRVCLSTAKQTHEGCAS